jgi:hypothetical protein
VRGLSLVLHAYQVLVPTDIQAQFPACAARGAGVVGTSTYPSIPNTGTADHEKYGSGTTLHLDPLSPGFSVAHRET